MHEQRLGHGGSRAVGQLHDRAVGNVVDRHGQRGLLGGAGASDAGRRETGIAGAGADILGGSGGRAVLCGCFRAFRTFVRVCACVAARGAFRVTRLNVAGRLVIGAIAAIFRIAGVCGILAVFPGASPRWKGSASGMSCGSCRERLVAAMSRLRTSSMSAR